MLAVICLLQLDAVVIHNTVSRYIAGLAGDQRQSRLLSIQIFQFFRITGAVDSQIVPFSNQLQIIEIRNDRHLSGAEGKIDQLVRCG